MKTTLYYSLFALTASVLVAPAVGETQPIQRDAGVSSTTPDPAGVAPTATPSMAPAAALPQPPPAGDQPAPAGDQPAPAGEPSKKTGAEKFKPPSESDIPDNEFGKSVRLGKQIFENTQQHAARYVGNKLNCVNCHLDNGRRANSAPLWAAYVMYPAYRKKTGQIDTIQSRIQGCFLYSMNGTAPEWNSKEMVALVTYHYWLAKNAPNGVKMPGQGFVKVAKPALAPDLKRGEEVFKSNCAVCHGADGGGTKGADGKIAFPPLWGKDSFNWGAGMHRVDTAAGFIKENMPYGRFGTLSDQEAWDVALFMNSHERPKDPRYEKSLEHTRDTFHDEVCLYHRSPVEILGQIEKQEKSDAAAKKAKPASVPTPSEGLSPATAH